MTTLQYVFVCQTEDEEVFEEIRKLRLERGRLLQKIKVLEQQQSSATTALEEVLHFNYNTLISTDRELLKSHISVKGDALPSEKSDCQP